MRCPRISIAGLMGAAAVIAVDAAALRSLFAASDAIGIVTMASVLAFGMTILILRLVRTGESGSFLVGFEVFGGVALIAFLSASVLTDHIDEFTNSIIESVTAVVPVSTLNVAIDPFGAELNTVSEHPMGDLVLLSCIALVVTLPQLAFASFGGWLFGRFRIRLVRGPRQPEPGGTSV